MTFPLGSPPAGFAHCSFPTRAGVFFVGGTPVPSITLSVSGTTAYSVRDYAGTVVSSGSVTGTTVTPTAPSGGWKPGWYRVYLTGATNDPVYGFSLGATSFVVIRSDGRFPVPALGDSNGNAINVDLPMKAQVGSTARLTISNPGDPTATTGAGTDLGAVTGDVATMKATWFGPAYADPGRTREQWVAFDGQTWDRVLLPGAGSGIYVVAYPKDEALDGSAVYVALAAGSVSGAKIVVSYPNSSTVVETFDNLASPTATVATVNGTSSYINVYVPATQRNSTAGTLTATAIGRTHRDGVALVVSTLYPDVKHYEGPTNEPVLTDEIAHITRLFYGAVKAGNPNAKVIGPCPVSINNVTAWDAYLAAGGGGYIDEFSFHDYDSMANGMVFAARPMVDAFKAKLTQYGQGSKRLWQTEAGGAFTAVYGVHHPRRARVKAAHTLMWEQYGVPRERNVYWYDRHNGFWDFPMWMMAGDRSLTPEFVVQRVLAEETYGMTHASALSFGVLGDRIFMGSVFSGAGGKCVELLAFSYMPGATVTLTVTGASGTLTTVDAFGNTNTAAITNGRVTVPVGDVPTYVRLPAGATATAYSINDWPPIGQPSLGYSSSWQSVVQPSAAHGVVNDGAFMSGYPDDAHRYLASGTTPDTVTLTWPDRTTFDRVVIWCAASWQSSSSLVDFDVQTSSNGSTWTTRATVTRPTPTSFRHGTDDYGQGCTFETYWDEQWIFDVPIPGGPVTAKYLRLNVRATSYGGEPDALAVSTSGGQGDSAQHVCVQEVAVLCDANTYPQIVVG